MTDDPYIKRRAVDLINRHGDQVAIHATMEADAMLEVGDMDGVYF